MISLAGRMFKPPGPVAAAFMSDRRNQVRALLGPQGGGKTVTCIHDLIANAALMPACRDGVVRFRVAAVRDTYARLEETTIRSWTEWVPKDAGEWTGGGGRQAHHKLRYEVLRGSRKTPVEFEMIFAAIGDQSSEDFMRGFEVTAFWFNEVDLLSEDVLTYGLGRIGRYPKQADMPDGTRYRDFIIADLNAPDVDSWFYRRFEEDRPDGFRLYRQPSGRSAKAENIHNLKPGYYDDQVRLNAAKPRWIRRFVDAEYGPSDDGEPVFPEFSDERHMAREPLAPLKGVPLRIGLDAGLQRPAGIIGQWLPSGQWRILGEVVPGRMGAKRFAELLRQWLAEHAPDETVMVAYADPAGFAGADKEAGELAWAETIQSELQVPVVPAPSNEIGLRLDAVREELNFNLDATTPAFVVSPRCTVLRKALVSHYRYRRELVAGTQRFSDKPEKNDWSHPADALQYLLLGSKGRHAVVGSGRERRRPQAGASKGSTTIQDGGWSW